MYKVALGRIVATVGLNGMVKCKLYSSPPLWKDAYVSISGADMRIRCEQYPYAGKAAMCLCSCPNISNITDAASLVGGEIWIDRKDLPKSSDDEIYLCDIIGRSVIYHNEVIGHVKHVHDFGAGVLLELDSSRYVHWKHIENVSEENLRVADLSLEE